jgi:hypothetical protein
MAQLKLTKKVTLKEMGRLTAFTEIQTNKKGFFLTVSKSINI